MLSGVYFQFGTPVWCSKRNSWVVGFVDGRDGRNWLFAIPFATPEEPPCARRAPASYQSRFAAAHHVSLSGPTKHRPASFDWPRANGSMVLPQDADQTHGVCYPKTQTRHIVFVSRLGLIKGKVTVVAFFGGALLRAYPRTEYYTQQSVDLAFLHIQLLCNVRDLNQFTASGMATNCLWASRTRQVQIQAI